MASLATKRLEKKKKTYFTLKQKVEVIKMFRKNSRMSQQSRAEQFECGRTQIASILKDKESLMSFVSLLMKKNKN